MRKWSDWPIAAPLLIWKWKFLSGPIDPAQKLLFQGANWRPHSIRFTPLWSLSSAESPVLQSLSTPTSGSISGGQRSTSGMNPLLSSIQSIFFWVGFSLLAWSLDHLFAFRRDLNRIQKPPFSDPNPHSILYLWAPTTTKPTSAYLTLTPMKPSFLNPSQSLRSAPVLLPLLSRHGCSSYSFNYFSFILCFFIYIFSFVCTPLIGRRCLLPRESLRLLTTESWYVFFPVPLV